MISAHCCRACEDEYIATLSGLERFTARRFVVCRTCGNKRCPKAQHHDRACTGSNEPGQEGGG